MGKQGQEAPLLSYICPTWSQFKTVQSIMDNTSKVIILTLIVGAMAGCLSICSWNMRSLTSAGPYLDRLAAENDIIIGSEHRLFNNQLYKINAYLPRCNIHAKASSDLSDE